MSSIIVDFVAGSVGGKYREKYEVIVIIWYLYDDFVVVISLDRISFCGHLYSLYLLVSKVVILFVIKFVNVDVIF